MSSLPKDYLSFVYLSPPLDNFYQIHCQFFSHRQFEIHQILLKSRTNPGNTDSALTVAGLSKHSTAVPGR